MSTTEIASICAVIVSYNPSADVLENISALRSQVKLIIVVDNGSTEHSLKMLRDGRSALNFEVIENAANLGSAAALNIGVREARAKGCSWVALFDQDSKVDPGFIESMLDAIEAARDPSQVGIVCPIYVDRSTGITCPIRRSKAGEVLFAMTSGSLIPVKLFDRIGAFNESFFIDYVDIEFCLRSRRAGYQILQADRAVLHHSLGRITRHRVGRHWFGSTNHNAARRYYITRNRLRVLWQFLRDFSWSLTETRSVVTETVKIILVEEDRFKKLRNIVFGCADAFRGRMGKRFEL